MIIQITNNIMSWYNWEDLEIEKDLHLFVTLGVFLNYESCLL